MLRIHFSKRPDDDLQHFAHYTSQRTPSNTNQFRVKPTACDEKHDIASLLKNDALFTTIIGENRCILYDSDMGLILAITEHRLAGICLNFCPFRTSL